MIPKAKTIPNRPSEDLGQSAEDKIDLAIFKIRQDEPLIPFKKVLKTLKLHDK